MIDALLFCLREDEAFPTDRLFAVEALGDSNLSVTPQLVAGNLELPRPILRAVSGSTAMAPAFTQPMQPPATTLSTPQVVVFCRLGEEWGSYVCIHTHMVYIPIANFHAVRLFTCVVLRAMISPVSYDGLNS